MDDSNAGTLSIADYSQWQARDYFETYYSQVVLPDEQVVLRYQLDVMQRAATQFGRGLEYGCGPTLHRAIAAAKYVAHLDMADWLPDNLVCVRDWVSKPSSRDWSMFTRFVLDAEKRRRVDAASVRQREARTRKVVNNLFVSDARWKFPLGPERESYYDLLVSGFCLDAVSSDKKVWKRCMHNVLSMIAPGGTLITHALHRCKAYKVGLKMFPGANLTVDNMATMLLDAGFAPNSIDVQVIPCPDNAEYGYSGILTASARKAH